MVLGATLSPGSIGGTNNRRFTFDNDTMSLTEALAQGRRAWTRREPTQEVSVSLSI